MWCVARVTCLVIDKTLTHSLRGFVNYIKVLICGTYEDHSHVLNCYMQTLKYMLRLILLNYRLSIDVM